MNKLQAPQKTQKEDKIKSFNSLAAKIEKRRQRARSAKRKRLVMASVCVAAAAALAVCAGLSFDIPAMVREAIYYHRDAPPAQPGAPQSQTPVGEVLNVTEVTHDYVVLAQYPALSENTKSAARADLDLLLSGFLKDAQAYRAKSAAGRAVCTVSFLAEVLTEGYFQVTYQAHQSFPNLGRSAKETQVKIYGTTQGASLAPGDIFSEKFPAFLSSYVRAYFANDQSYAGKTQEPAFLTATEPLWENFSDYSFSKQNFLLRQSLSALFPGQEGEVSITIPVEKIFPYLNLNVTGYEPPPKFAADPTRPMVALTFDDGPYPPVTGRILNQLEAAGGRATFFVMGNRASKFSEAINRAVSLGCEIANHTYDHKSLTGLDAAGITWEISAAAKEIEVALGAAPTLVRPPYGAVNAAVGEAAGAPLILWSLDTQDWKSRDKNAVANAILSRVKDGDIILMHDLYPSTADAMEIVIPKLSEMGYQLLTVSQLFEAKGVALENGKTYSQAR